MIKIKNIKKSFGKNEVLKGINLEINKGDVVAIIGPSGTGKSTFLRCINNLEQADEGTIEFDDFSIDFKNYKKSESLTLRRKTSMVFQSFNLFSKKTALENVLEGLIVVQKIQKSKAIEIALEQLKKVRMDDRLDYYPKHLSGGQQQRVAIARALALKPELILFDEPTSALDPELVGEVLETIKQIANDGNTMIIVSHEMQFVKNVATKVIFMEKGKIIEEGTVSQIFEAPKNERTKEFLLKNNFIIPLEYNL